MRAHRTLAALGLAVVVAVGVGPVSAGAGGNGHGHGRDEADVVLDDLSSPKGLAVDEFGNPIVGQGAFGAPGPVLYHVPQGRRSLTIPITSPLNFVDIGVTLDGAGWGLGPAVNPAPGEAATDTLYYRDDQGTITPVANIADYQATDPDPVDQDVPPNPIESNPYGLAVLPNGDALVADAAGNDVLRVTRDGAITTVARFDLEVVPVDPALGLPFTEAPAEAVPTSIAVGRDGWVYVGELKGFPFTPGTSNVWRFRADAVGATCSVTAPVNCERYASGLTAIQDIALGSSGRLFVYELAEDGVLAFEEGLGTGEFPPAVLLEVSKGGRRQREIAEGELSQPGGIGVTPYGDLWVTDNVFTPDAGRLLRIER